MKQNAVNALKVIKEYENFNNDDNKVFGYANWREGYPVWFQQITQKDAEKLSGIGDRNKLGSRKYYERTYMTNPLAIAAIVDFSGDSTHCDTMKK